MESILIGVAAFAGGALLWLPFEYGLHLSFHVLKGKGFASRAHLDHHVHASWHFDPIITLAWLGVVLFGIGFSFALAAITSAVFGIAFGAGWTVGYFFYEWHHRQSHLRGPRNRWEAWLRKNHFQHHFGHPMKNQGVTASIFDRLFGSYDMPEKVKVPRRLAMPWLFDSEGNLLAEYQDDYEIVGTSTSTDERQRQIDKARAYASRTPEPV